MGCAFVDLGCSSPRPRFRLIWIESSTVALTLSSRASEEREPDGVDLRGDSALLCDLVALSARPDEFEEVEECCDVDCKGWLARAALEERLAVSIVAMD